MAEKKSEVLGRLKAIELLAYWEGRLVTNRLIQWFGISRQQASLDIKTYNTIYNQSALVHDPSVKSYIPQSSFQPVLTQGNLNEYLDLISSFDKDSFAYILQPEDYVISVQLPERAVKPEIVRILMQAIKQHHCLKIIYASMQNPVWHERLITPHSLIYSGFRWHVRAYCHQHSDFRDFIISRIHRTPTVLEEDLVNTVERDTLWQEEIQFSLTANPKLDSAQQLLIESDFNMPAGELPITVKKALLPYTLQRFQVALNESEEVDALRYPIVVKAMDRKKLKPYLFIETVDGCNRD